MVDVLLNKGDKIIKPLDDRWSLNTKIFMKLSLSSMFQNAEKCLVLLDNTEFHMSMVSCQKGPTRHAYAWQIRPIWQDTLDVSWTQCWFRQSLLIKEALSYYCTCWQYWSPFLNTLRPRQNDHNFADDVWWSNKGGDKPLSEPMMAQYTDANICHLVPMGKFLHQEYLWLCRGTNYILYIPLWCYTSVKCGRYITGER